MQLIEKAKEIVPDICFVNISGHREIEKLLHQICRVVLKYKDMDGKLLPDLCEKLIGFLAFGLKKMNSEVLGEQLIIEFEENFHMCTTVQDVFEELGLSFRKDLQAKIPKLTLQPIIENAVSHGLERKSGNGTVKISVDFSKESLWIVVKDDGIGTRVMINLPLVIGEMR